MNPNLIILKSSAPRFFSKRKTTRDEFKLGMTTTYIMMLLFIGVLGIYYVWSLNVNATNGYMIRNLEAERKSLIVEKDLLDIKIAELESLSNLRLKGVKGKVKITEIKYLVKKDGEQYAYNDIK